MCSVGDADIPEIALNYDLTSPMCPNFGDRDGYLRLNLADIPKMASNYDLTSPMCSVGDGHLTLNFADYYHIEKQIVRLYMVALLSL